MQCNSSNHPSNNFVAALILIFIFVLTNLKAGVGFSFSSSISSSSRKFSSTSGSNHHLQLPKKDDCVDCAIVGGGPAGLATAIAISKASPSSSIAIFEKDAFEPKGSTVAISSAGSKSLKKLHAPLVAKLKDTAVSIREIKTRAWTYNREEEERKQLVAKEQFILKRVVKKFTKKMVTILLTLVSRFVIRVHSWHDVRMYLKDEADKLYEENLELIKDIALPLFNSNCILTNVHEKSDNNTKNKEQKERFELEFQNTKTGEERKIFSKYLFACDGTRSAVRSILPKEPDILLAEKKSVWRGTAPNCPSTSTMFWKCAANDDTTGRSAAIFPAGRGLGTAWSVISDIEDGKSTSTEEARERVLKVLETMNAVDTNPDYHVLKQCIDDSSIIIENKLHIRDFDKPWESAYSGLIYIGDAAHPVRPTGEGLALAFEDANVLYQLISEFGLSVATLRKYEDKRFLPVKTISEKVRAQAESNYTPIKEKADAN